MEQLRRALTKVVQTRSDMCDLKPLSRCPITIGGVSHKTNRWLASRTSSSEDRAIQPSNGLGTHLAEARHSRVNSFTTVYVFHCTFAKEEVNIFAHLEGAHEVGLCIVCGRCVCELHNFRSVRPFWEGAGEFLSVVECVCIGRWEGRRNLINFWRRQAREGRRASASASRGTQTHCRALSSRTWSSGARLGSSGRSSGCTDLSGRSTGRPC